MNQLERRTGTGVLFRSTTVEYNFLIRWWHPSSLNYGRKRSRYSSLDVVHIVLLLVPGIDNKDVSLVVDFLQ